jgi:hypothetical protein
MEFKSKTSVTIFDGEYTFDELKKAHPYKYSRAIASKDANKNCFILVDNGNDEIATIPCGKSVVAGTKPTDLHYGIKESVKDGKTIQELIAFMPSANTFDWF